MGHETVILRCEENSGQVQNTPRISTEYLQTTPNASTECPQNIHRISTSKSNSKVIGKAIGKHETGDGYGGFVAKLCGIKRKINDNLPTKLVLQWATKW